MSSRRSSVLWVPLYGRFRVLVPGSSNNFANTPPLEVLLGRHLEPIPIADIECPGRSPEPSGTLSMPYRPPKSTPQTWCTDMTMEAWDALGKLRLPPLWLIMMVGTISGLRTALELVLRDPACLCDDAAFRASATVVSHPERVRLGSYHVRHSPGVPLEKALCILYHSPSPRDLLVLRRPEFRQKWHILHFTTNFYRVLLDATVVRV